MAVYLNKVDNEITVIYDWYCDDKLVSVNAWVVMEV